MKRIVVLLSFLLFLQIQNTSHAEGGKMSFNTTLNNEELLKSLQGNKKKINLVLKNGVTYTGLIEAVGSQFVVLSHLSGGKDFFDARIAMDEIVAIEAQTRTQ